jgi:putative RNA 2'-phosphotransferase
MNEQQKSRISKFLSLVLRHKPDTIGLRLDEQGWAAVDELLVKCAAHQHPFTAADLKEVVLTNDKQRFAFNEEGTRIRASQGHSVSVDLNLAPQVPPDTLYHGTVERFLSDIKATGLKKMSRQQVHLSRDIETAQKVGTRRGAAIILTIDSRKMYVDGYTFFLSENGVWLTDYVPAGYITFNAD